MKKVVFPLIAVVTLGLAGGALGCHAEAKLNAGGEAKTPPPPPPEPAKPDPPPPPPAEAKPVVLKPIGKAKIENNEIKIPGKIKFDFDKATIREDAETKEVLKTLLDVMKENPSITKLRIEGHTDDKGKADFNQKLSEERADSVVAWLKKNGIEESRLSHKGFGQERPIVKNDTEPHREQNRRVEFKIWEIDGKATEAQKTELGGGAPSAAGLGAQTTAGGAASGKDAKKDDKATSTTPKK